MGEDAEDLTIMTGSRWEVKDYDPQDEAPEGEPDHDCTGEKGDN